MKKIISFILGLSAAFGALAQVVAVRLSEPGTLARELGSQKETAVTLKVAGPLNSADFKTLWEASLYGELRHLDLSEADPEGCGIPDNAFWDRSVQAGGDAVKLESVVLPSNLEAIGKYAFSWAVALKSVTFPSSLRQLGRSCFSHCKSLTGDPFTLPEGVSEIPQSCFMECGSLTNVTLPNTIKGIGTNAFYNCDLAAINFPDELESIGDMAFYGCLLKNVALPASCGSIHGKYIFGLNPELVSLALPDGMVVIPEAIAQDCRQLTTLRLPSDAKIIGNAAFENCVALREVRFPEGLECIGTGAFRGCHQIEELDLPSSLTVLGQLSFCEMPRLQRVYCKAIYPPMCEEYITNHEHGTLKGSFGEIEEKPAGSATPRGIPVFVPTGSENAYRGIWSWNYFTNIQGTSTFPGEAAIGLVNDSENIQRVTVRGNELSISALSGTAFEIFLIDGTRIAGGTVSELPVTISLPTGVYIVKVGEAVCKVAM